MPARVLVIALDAANATLIERWASRGHLPNIAALRARASAFSIRPECMELLPGAIWGDIAYGEPSWRHGHFFTFEQYFPNEGRMRRIRDDEISAERMFWGIAAQAGKRCAVIDMPFMPINPGFNGIQLREFTTHDLCYGAKSEPSELLTELIAKHGEPPLHDVLCDFEAARSDCDTVYRSLLKGIAIKGAVVRDVLSREEWDLFFAVFGESHCAAHYLWPKYNKNRKGYISRVSGIEDPWEALRSVYVQLDKELGALIAEAGADSKIILFTSHSVGAYFGGPQFIAEVLRRMGLSDGWEWPGRKGLREMALRLREHIPIRDLQDIGTKNGKSIVNAARIILGASRYPANMRRCKAFATANNRIGGLRLKIKGRDYGATMTLTQSEATKLRIVNELESLVDPTSGERLVKSIIFADELGPERSPLLPDVIVKFRTDLGPLEQAYSPKLGLLRISNERPCYDRSGDHTPQSRAWIAAPAYPANARGFVGDTLDIAPTVLELLSVKPPSHMAGIPLSARSSLLNSPAC